MSQRKIALVGAGSMGRNHARVIAENLDAELAVVIDPFEATGRPTAERYGATWAPDISAVEGMDAVVVAASTEYHYDIAKDIIQARLPMLIEKPVCPSFAQTVEILTASEAADVPIMCGFLERYNPAVIVAKRMMGEPLYVRAERHSPYAPRIKTGVAWDLLVHDVDLIAQLFGGVEPDAINVEAGRFHPDSLADAEDVVEASLRFPGGGVASASASRLGQRKVRTMVVQSLDQMIEIDLLRRGVTSYRHSTISSDESDGAGFRQSTEMEVPEIIGKEPLAAQLERFLKLVDGEADAAEERSSILPAHRIVDAALAKNATISN
jgi:predicted dehydrogenase